LHSNAAASGGDDAAVALTMQIEALTKQMEAKETDLTSKQQAIDELVSCM